VNSFLIREFVAILTFRSALNYEILNP